MRHHSEALGAVLPPPEACGVVLDCAAGMGTLALTLASAGYTVEGSDLAEASIERAQREATTKGLNATFRIDDIRKLEKAPLNHYGAVLALENVIPHLATEEAMRATLQAMMDRLRPGGILVVGIRDYEKLIAERPAIMPPTFHGDDASRRIVHEVWDWHDERSYTFHLYITRLRDQRWDVLHFTGTYRAITKAELAQMMTAIGCEGVEILAPDQSGFHQPVVVGRRKAAEAAIAVETPAVVTETAPVSDEATPTVPSEIVPPEPAGEVEAAPPPENTSAEAIAASVPEPPVEPAPGNPGEAEFEVEIELPVPQPMPSEPPVDRGTEPAIEQEVASADTPFELPVVAEACVEPVSEPADHPESVVPFEYKEPAQMQTTLAAPAPPNQPKAEVVIAPEPAEPDFEHIEPPDAKQQELAADGGFVQIENETVRIDPITSDAVTSSPNDSAPPMEIAEALARLEPVAIEEDNKETVLSSSRPKRFVF